MYRAWLSPVYVGVVQHYASFAQRIEHVDVPGGFRYALGTVLRNKPAVLIEDLDLRIGLAGIGAVRPLVFVIEPHGTVVGTTNFVQTVI